MRTPTVTIVQGNGLVARFGSVVLYLAEASTATEEILGAAEAAGEGDLPEAALARRLAEILFAGGSEPPPFGAVVPIPDGIQVLLHGGVTAQITGAERTVDVSGARALTWVDEVVREPVQRIAVAADPDDASRPNGAVIECPHTDLRAGVVPGGGFVAHAPAFGGRPSAPGRERQVADAPDSSSEPKVAPPPPTLEPDLRTTAPPDAPPAPQTVALGEFFGVLTAEDGAAYPLDRTYVIGREPLSDDDVRRALASPIVIRDDPQISRVHAHLSIEQGTVYVRDCDTPGGTYVAPPGADSWEPVGSRPAELKPGWSLRVGTHVFTFSVEAAS